MTEPAHSSSEKEMSFVEHLSELRRALVFSVLGLLIGAGVGFWYHQPMLDLLMAKAGNVNFVIVSPAEGFIAVMRLSILLGLFLGVPVALRELLWFVGPALSRRQRWALVPMILISYALFIAGAALAYYVFLPIGIKFLVGFTPAGIQPMLSIDRYIGFASLMIFSTGLIFQVPVVMLLMAFVGILHSQPLRQQRRYVVIISFIIAAVLTPADVMSQILLGTTLLILFEAGLALMWLVERLRPRPNYDITPVESEIE
ncbi:MAG: twin-arginine translocase subunit TatC [Candidatus Sericytochromatia bacterium]|nr:twin-arginine translocase subunit TatC [Candidatus Sericytochromatia bacterium]